MQLQHSQLWNRVLEPGDRIAVASGQLWLTFEGEDIVLDAQQAWTAPRRGEVMAQPLRTACFSVDTATKTPVSKTKQNWPQWYGHKWLEGLRVPHLRLHL